MPSDHFNRKNDHRLAKLVAQAQGCSRREAQMYIEGGYVSVNGHIVLEPGYRVLDQHRVDIAKDARLEPALPVTLLLHKPPEFDAIQGRRLAAQWLTPHHRFIDEHSAPLSVQRINARHFVGQDCVTPLEFAASGLIVYTQDFRIQRKLVEDASLNEHEMIVDVEGNVTPEALHWLNQPPIIDGRAMLAAKVSINKQVGAISGLRFALKGYYPGQIAQMCTSVQLRVVAMRRIRIGRLPLASLPLGQWRYLLPYERF